MPRLIIACNDCGGTDWEWANIEDDQQIFCNGCRKLIDYADEEWHAREADE